MTNGTNKKGKQSSQLFFLLLLETIIESFVIRVSSTSLNHGKVCGLALGTSKYRVYEVLFCENPLVIK